VMDLVFAVDSIPAIFAVTRDPYIVYTSNVFAILGLRSLYFLLANMVDKFHYLRIGLAFVLTFIGVKMLVVAVGIYIPVIVSLGVVTFMISSSIAASLIWRKKPDTSR
ncbi:MAG: TerC family protein, partial [Pyrinomonadaceae bacterium]